jgi:hypothetical protein
MIDLEAIRSNVTVVRRLIEQQPRYFSDGDAPPKTPTEQLVYDALDLLAEVEALRERVPWETHWQVLEDKKKALGDVERLRERVAALEDGI